MYPPTYTKIKLKKQIFSIDIFYSNYKENLYNSYNINTNKVNSNAFKCDSSTPHHNKDGYLRNKDGGIITKTD
jgi:hypothetical protein